MKKGRIVLAVVGGLIVIGALGGKKDSPKESEVKQVEVKQVEVKQVEEKKETKTTKAERTYTFPYYSTTIEIAINRLENRGYTKIGEGIYKSDKGSAYVSENDEYVIIEEHIDAPYFSGMELAKKQFNM